MGEFALRQQGKAGERVGILTARQRAEPPDRRVIDADRAAVAAGPSQLFGPGRHQLAVAAEQAAIGADGEVAVMEGADADRVALVDPDDPGAVMISRSEERREGKGGVRPCRYRWGA